MSDEALLTLRQMALELGLPESTARYYRDAFLDHIPAVGTGRRRRYPREALAILGNIARGYASGRTKPDMVAAMAGGTAPPAAAVAVTRRKAVSHAPLEVSSLDVLAAILDGEREQRDALWRMVKEVARLTDVLQVQHQVLVELVSRAGVAATAPPALAAAPRDNGEAPAADVADLEARLEAERSLVERLRAAKLDLEHRAADAEAALAEQRPRRTSVIGRILGVRE